jgi:uroporphyrin-III C-methyltransferase/precorrin-2 dehydrogenase/sirohydrochlorin ferrochelatase
LLLLYAVPWASLPSVYCVDDLKSVQRLEKTNEAREGNTFRAFSFSRRLRIALFPAFLKLHGRRVVVVGGGPVAASKLAALQAAGADIRVVAPQVCETIVAAGVTIERRAFEPSDLDGAWFVVAAAPPDVNRRVGQEAARRQLFVNAVDDPDNATVYLGGVVRRDGVTLAISTDGSAPALAGLLREALDEVLPPDLDAWSRCARQLRPSWRARQVPMEARRPELLDALNALYGARKGDGRAEEPVT